MTFELFVRFDERVGVEIQSACLGQPRCFATPPDALDEDVISAGDFEGIQDLWRNNADARRWYQCQMEDATGFFGDSACPSARCPGVFMGFRIGSANLVTGTIRTIPTWRCPAGTMKWARFTSSRAMTFVLEPDADYLLDRPDGCLDVGDERRCDAGTYTYLATSKDPELACTATSIRDVQCNLNVTGSLLRGACEGYAECTEEGRQLSAVEFQVPESVVSDWSDGISINDDPKEPGQVFCFPGDAIVDVKGKGKVTMMKLELGDDILTDAGYETVYSFGHRNNNIKSRFLKISTPSSVIEVSPDHMVFVKDGRSVPASAIEVGDELSTAVSGVYSRVSAIGSVEKKGAYAPFTTSGTVIVNDIKASCFISIQEGSSTLLVGGFDSGISHQFLARTFEAPHRAYCQILDCSKETYDSRGISNWVSLPQQYFSGAANDASIILLLPAFAVPVAVAYPLETILLIASAVYCLRKFRGVVRKSKVV